MRKQNPLKKIIFHFISKEEIIKENKSQKKEIQKLISTIENMNQKVDEYEFLLSEKETSKKIEELQYLLNQYRSNKRELQAEIRQLRRENISYYITMSQKK